MNSSFIKNVFIIITIGGLTDSEIAQEAEKDSTDKSDDAVDAEFKEVDDEKDK